MMANQARFGVQTMCRVLKVSSSGYYGWLKRVVVRSNSDQYRGVDEPMHCRGMIRA